MLNVSIQIQVVTIRNVYVKMLLLFLAPLNLSLCKSGYDHTKSSFSVSSVISGHICTRSSLFLQP